MRRGQHRGGGEEVGDARAAVGEVVFEQAEVRAERLLVPAVRGRGNRYEMALRISGDAADLATVELFARDEARLDGLADAHVIGDGPAYRVPP